MDADTIDIPGRYCYELNHVCMQHRAATKEELEPGWKIASGTEGTGMSQQAPNRLGIIRLGSTIHGTLVWMDVRNGHCTVGMLPQRLAM